MQMNGLKLSNSWAGYSILLNPPYTAAAQWRFVNRAIDEVENDNVLLPPPPFIPLRLPSVATTECRYRRHSQLILATGEACQCLWAVHGSFSAPDFGLPSPLRICLKINLSPLSKARMFFKPQVR